MRLSHQLAPLSVVKNKIVNARTGVEVILRGVNRSGLEYSSPVDSLGRAGISEPEIREIVEHWGASIIRLPFNQEWALETPGYDPQPYRTAIEAVVEMAARRGAYTLLDLQWLDTRIMRGTVSGEPNYVAPLPNSDSIVLWEQLGAIWRDEPAILFDIFNEPHDVLPDDHEPALGIREDGSTFSRRSRRVGRREWHPWARHLIRAIRRTHQDALIFVPGTEWAYDLRDHPLAGVTGVVYSTHVYPAKRLSWDKAFGELAEVAPVFVGEWGGGDEDLAWGQRLLTYLEQRHIGWTAWSWSDRPRLIETSTDYTPTRFGALVKAALCVKTSPS
jgi:endoglucanase